MSKELAINIELFDEPPANRNEHVDWSRADEIALVLIDNPGKWAIIQKRDKIKNRACTLLQARYGKGFQFKTRLNAETGLVDVWASYHE